MVLGTVSALFVPFLVTGVYRIGFELPFWLEAVLPFVLLSVLALWLWRFTQLKSVALGIVGGSLIYGVALTLIIIIWSRGPQIP